MLKKRESKKHIVEQIESSMIKAFHYLIRVIQPHPTPVACSEVGRFGLSVIT